MAAVKYALKAYFGGCFGCLGALCATIALSFILAITLGPGALAAMKSIPLPALLPLLAPGMLPMDQGMPPMDQGMSPMVTPDELPAPMDCYTTIDAWASKSDMGQPATTFLQTDGIFPVVTNPTDCGTVKARLIDSRGQTFLEKSYSVVGGGRNGYGNFNLNKNLVPGSYEMQFWNGEVLLESIQLNVQ